MQSKMEGFIADAQVLGQTLQTLLDGASVDLKFALFTSAENRYQICFVPPNTKHLLGHVVGKSASSFFLVGKAPESEDPAVEDDQSPALLRFQNERVPIGTSISQEVVYLCGSEALHSSHGHSLIKECYLSQGSIQPVSLESARYLQSLHAYLLRNDAIDLLPFWSLVDGNEPQCVTFTATVPGHVSVNAKRPGQAHVVFTCSAEALNAKESLPDLAVFQKQHLSGIRGVGFNVTTHGYALYEVMGSAYGDTQDSTQSKIIVEFAWDQVGALLQPPPHSCDGVLHIKSIPGNEHVATYPLFLELQRLEKLSQLLNGEELPWPATTSDSIEPVSERMTDFLQKLYSGRVFSPAATEVSPINSPCLLQLAFSEFERKDLDFTEHLWLVLKDACDDEDLITSLQTALSALFSGECQPVVHTANKTPFAEFIRGILHCETKETQQQLQERAREYVSSITAAIELLVEIGSDKLGRDYAQFLLGDELATVGQLVPFLNCQLPAMSKVSNIKKLHQTVELVSMAKSITKIGHGNLRTLAQQALVFYSSHSADNLPMFSLSLPAFGSTSGTAMKSVCVSSQPSVWCVSMKSKTKRGEHTTVIQLSSRHPTKPLCTADFEPDVSDLGEEVFSGDPAKKKTMYFLSRARKLNIAV